MAQRQAQCEKELKHWKKAFFQIHLPASKVQAVNRLCEFAMEMRAYWPDTRMAKPSNPALAPMEPITVIPGSDRYNQAEPAVDPFRVQAEAASDNKAVVNFSGVIEGAPVPARMEVDAVEAGVAIPGVDERMIDLYGYCPNPRLLQGRFVDTLLPICVWKGPRNWRLPQKVLCRKDPTSPHYTPV